MSIYCGLCTHLSITEHAQNNLINGSEIPHVCKRFGKQVMHGESHPKLPRLRECFALGKVHVQQPLTQVKSSDGATAEQIAEVIKQTENKYYGVDIPSEVDDVLDEFRQLLLT